MRAVVFHGVGDIRLEDVDEPRVEQPTDAVVRLTRSAICGTDLHMVRGTFAGMRPGTVLGHEGVGIVEEVGDDVRNLQPGDRVVVPSTIACGNCRYCRQGLFAQCERANPNGPEAGTAFYGGPAETGPFQGLQAERARVPFANVNLVKLPEAIDDDQAILLSDIFPTGWFAADLAGITPGCAVAVFGCGPVGQFAVASAFLMDAGRVIAVDAIPSRLEMAREQGAECVDFESEDPIETMRQLTGGEGVDRVIEAVGVDAVRGRGQAAVEEKKAAEELTEVAPEQHPSDGNWHPGDAPSQALSWAVESVGKAGVVSIVGVYPPAARSFPIGKAMNKNLTIRMGNCNHRKYIPHLIQLVLSGVIDPSEILTQEVPLSSAIEAYRAFDRREPGWIKVELQPSL